MENLANQLAHGAVNFGVRVGTWQAVQRAEQGLLKAQCLCNFCETCETLLQDLYFLEVCCCIVTFCAQRISLWFCADHRVESAPRPVTFRVSKDSHESSVVHPMWHSVPTAPALYRSTVYTGSQYDLCDFCVLCLRVSTPKCRCRLQWKPGRVFLSSVWILTYLLIFVHFLSLRVEIDRFESATLESMPTCSKYSSVIYLRFILTISFCDVPGQTLEVCRFDPALSCFHLFSVCFGWGFSAFEARCDSNSDGHWPWG